MIENWVDEMAKVWQGIVFGQKTVRSYKLIEKAEFPDSIDPADLDLTPVALTISASMEPEYSAGGPALGYWKGVTEFHVSPDLDRGRLPSIIPWFGLIVKAAAGHMKLNSTVELFLVENITGPMALQYGNESPHWGFIVTWNVKERIEGELTVSA